jgi:hypothetical protein
VLRPHHARDAGRIIESLRIGPDDAEYQRPVPVQNVAAALPFPQCGIPPLPHASVDVWLNSGV